LIPTKADLLDAGKSIAISSFNSPVTGTFPFPFPLAALTDDRRGGRVLVGSETGTLGCESGISLSIPALIIPFLFFSGLAGTSI
jgi:hypothetical protein